MFFNLESLPNTLMTLAQNMGMLLALTFLYSTLLPMRQRLSPPIQPVVMGLLFGLFAVLVMLNPVDLGGGVRIDGRSIVVALACLYGGSLAGFISAGVVIPVRFAMGGVGTYSAVGAVLTIVALCVWYKRRYAKDGELQPRQLILLGILISFDIMFWILVISPERGSQTISTIAIPSLLFNPLTLVLVGQLLSHERQRSELENALRESEVLFKQIADASERILWIYDPGATKPVYISPAYSRIWGRPIDEINNDVSILVDTFHPDDRLRAWQQLQNPTNAEVATEVRILRPDGEVRWIAARLHPLPGPGGKAERVVGTAEDITDRKQAEAQKLELQIERERGHMLRQFINASSHDLRTPITIMRTSLYLLERTSKPEQKAYLEQLDNQIYRMTRLIDDMLTISYLDADDVPLMLQPGSINDFAAEAVQRHSKEAATKERQLTTDFAAVSPWAQIDSAQLNHALERLIKNAIAYSVAGDSITVSTALVGQEAVIRVTDTGQGISAQDLPRIFERFYRADKARGVTSGGAGLGLSIARRIVELHHGRIEVESTLDEGSTFSIILPAVAPDQETSSPKSPGERRYS